MSGEQEATEVEAEAEAGGVRPARPSWLLAACGAVAAVVGVALSEATAWTLRADASPLDAVAATVRDLTPGAVVEAALSLLGGAGKPVLLAGTVLVVLGVCAYAASRLRQLPLLPDVVFVVLAAIGLAAVLVSPSPSAAAALSVLVGLITWIVVLRLLTGPLLDDRPVDGSGRRTFLVRLGVVVVGASALTLGGRLAGGARRAVEAARSLLRLPVTPGDAPAGSDLGIDGLEPWRTPTSDFYLIHTAIAAPSIRPAEWELRVHGMVERELRIGYEDLLSRRIREAWVTLTCVSNEVGGDLVGNAWWSGVPVRSLLAEAGVKAGADAVLQTSADGWTCGTPLTALTDDRDALLAVAMNGRPLPVDHGFPVRMVVPGLYGYVSATKWLVDLEVTRFEDFSAYWTERGWGEKGPIKTMSRVDVPARGDAVAAGDVVIAGVAWAQHVGVRGVEVQVDGGPWLPAELGVVPSADTWVQWRIGVPLEPGEHTVVCRATDTSGYTQTSARADVLPDGATGWDETTFTAQ